MKGNKLFSLAIALVMALAAMLGAVIWTAAPAVAATESMCQTLTRENPEAGFASSYEYVVLFLFEQGDSGWIAVNKPPVLDYWVFTDVYPSTSGTVAIFHKPQGLLQYPVSVRAYFYGDSDFAVACGFITLDHDLVILHPDMFPIQNYYWEFAYENKAGWRITEGELAPSEIVLNHWFEWGLRFPTVYLPLVIK
jgi:hypothetical protein